MHPAARVTTVPPVRRVLALRLWAHAAAAARGARRVGARSDRAAARRPRGMTCTARTVVQGTTISELRRRGARRRRRRRRQRAADPRARVRSRGRRAAGSREGFSGSPVYCPDANGAIGNAGAISATIGQYGEDVGLVTPIEQMLGPARRRRRAGCAARRSCCAPPERSARRSCSSGLVAVARAARASAGPRARPHARRRARRTARHVPAAAARAGRLARRELSSGAVAASAIGTVTYRDGDAVWGFGHRSTSAGRRALLLQDAYVFTVVANPLDTSEARLLQARRARSHGRHALQRRAGRGRRDASARRRERCR